MAPDRHLGAGRGALPHGLRAISDHAHANGVRALVWFEPERVAPGTWLWQEHPEWLHAELPGTGAKSPVQRSRLLNLGLPEARRWLTDHVDRLLSEQGIDVYRQDFNFDPLPFWRQADARLSPIARDREGITENLHVQGYLAYWDELRRRHPGLLIDSCASGGRRNDLETLRRAVPLHPTDYDYADLATKQAFHATLFCWIPFFGSNTLPIETVDDYGVRSGHALSFGFCYDLRRPDLDLDRLRRLTREWRRVAPYYYGDFYPLTPWNRDEVDWLAWQFHRPDLGAGLIEAFRRADCADAGRTFSLWGLEPGATYEVQSLEAGADSDRDRGRAPHERGAATEHRRAPRRRCLGVSTGGVAGRTSGSREAAGGRSDRERSRNGAKVSWFGRGWVEGLVGAV